MSVIAGVKRVYGLFQRIFPVASRSVQKYSISKPEDEDAVVVSDDGRIVVCWHPEKDFPYECSRSLPEVVGTKSVLRNEYNEALRSVFKKDHPYFEIKRLKALTFTNKHIWYPRPERKWIRWKERQPRDRKYI